MLTLDELAEIPFLDRNTPAFKMAWAYAVSQGWLIDQVPNRLVLRVLVVIRSPCIEPSLAQADGRADIASQPPAGPKAPAGSCRCSFVFSHAAWR